MATLLLHTYAPAPRQGILLNPSPAASPAYHPASLPALVPSNSSLSSSASSSAPGDVSDYFSSSSSPSPGPSHSSPAPRNAHLHPNPKPRHGSNPGTVRRIRFAPLPEPRRDEDEVFPPVFLDDDEAGPSTTGDHMFAMSSALAAAVNCPLPESVPSSPCATRRGLPTTTHDALGLDPSSVDPSDPGMQQSQPSGPSNVGQEWDMASQSTALPALSLSLSVPESPRKSGKLSKMLKPFFSRSHNASTKSPLARTFSREETASMNGEAQRGRSSSFLSASSRNSSVSRDASLTRERRDSDFGAPLHRWTSEGGPNSVLPVSKKKRHMLFGGASSSGGVPLGRTQSLTSLSGKDDKKSKAQHPVVVTNGGRKQQRMLNGRVYGARRKPNANPFANVRTDEPEFVEWGYGGMGSVKNTSGQNSMWSRVQAGDDAAGLARKTADEDDGSGTAWVKRRREQRERERKEREAREKAEAEAKAKAKEAGAATAAQDGAPDVAAPAEEQKDDGEAAKQETEDAPADPSTIPLPASAPGTPLAPDTPKLEHITQAITIPANSHSHHRHHLSHSHSHSHHHRGHQHTLSMPFVERRESADAVHAMPVSSPSNVVSEESTPVSSTALLRTESEGALEAVERESVSSSSASAMSSTSDDADADEEESPKETEGGFGHDEDDEEEEEELERSRLTALGAGVEKIARHHKDKEDQGAVGTPAAE